MKRNPPTKPMMGEVTIGTTTLCRTPSMTSLPSFTFFTDQMMACQLSWALATAAPQRPPTRA